MLTVYKKTPSIVIFTKKKTENILSINIWRNSIIQKSPNIVNIPLLYAMKDNIYVWMQNFGKTTPPTYIFNTKEEISSIINDSLLYEAKLSVFYTGRDHSLGPKSQFEYIIQNWIEDLKCKEKHKNLPKDFLALFQNDQTLVIE